MNDHELDIILKKSLQPDVSVDDTLFNEKEELKNMKPMWIIKPAIALVACAAIVFSVFTFNNNANVTTNNSSQSTDTTNAFALKVKAVGKQVIELKKDVSIASRYGEVGAWGGGENDDNNYEAGYFETFPIACEGNNIDKITYSINNGTFQIFNVKGDGFVVDGEKVAPLDEGGILPKSCSDRGITNKEDMLAENYEEGYYSSFTVDPDFQESEDVIVNICDNLTVDEETYRKIWCLSVGPYKDKDISKLSKEENIKMLELVKEGMNDVLSNVVINCTVTYKDGTTESKEIGVTKIVVTPEEAKTLEGFKNKKVKVPSLYTAYKAL